MQLRRRLNAAAILKRWNCHGRLDLREALRRVLAHEGGYSNHPSDPGGPTNFGITIADYRKYAKPHATAADVKAMRLDEAKAIYRAHYWAPLCCDELPAGLDYAVFDYGVNSGVGRAARVLRRLAGLSGDAPLDAALLAAVRKRDARDLITRLCDERLSFLKRLKTWPVFGAGWGRRVAQVRAMALGMAASTPQPSAAVRHATAAGGIATAGAAAAQQAHQSGARPIIVLAIALATTALLVCLWLVWRRRRRNAS
jgi:lysozyme family protein